MKKLVRRILHSTWLICGVAAGVVAMMWSGPILAQSSVLVTSGMGSGASSTARLSVILQQQVSKVDAIEACGNSGKIYGKDFPLVDVNDCIATFSTSSDADESIVQILDFVTARHKFAPLSRELTVGGNITATGTLTANTPTAGGEVTTKDYVDTAIATIAASGGAATSSGGGSACYYTNNGECGSGFDMISGKIYLGSGGALHNICCSSSAGAIEPEGYFVATLGKYNGNLGGFAGADAKCLTELTTYDWRGKTEATAAGILTASNVKAWLCDGVTCQDLKAGRNYAFATADDINTGGNVFTASTAGIPLPPVGSWDLSTGRFKGSPMYNGYFWTARQNSGLIYTANHCTNWTSNSASIYGVRGHTGVTGSGTWSQSNSGCSNFQNLICMVQPN